MTDDPRQGRERAGTRGPSDEELERAIPRDTGGRELRLGAFVIVGLISFVVVLFLMTDPATLRGRYMVVTTMEDAGGVRRGDPVQMRGVNIGRVNGFQMTRDGNVRMRLEIEGEWQIPQDSRVTLGASGVFGGRTVEVVPGNDGEYLEALDTLPGTGMGDGIMELAEDLGGQAEEVMSRLNRTLDDPTISSLRTSAREIEAFLRDLRDLTETQRAELARLTETLNRSAEGLEEASRAGPDVRSAVARADSTLLRLNRTVATLDEASESLSVILARMEAGEGTLGRLSRDDSLYTNLNRAAESVFRLSEDVRENPGRYVRVEIF